jgi:hypothetical protein
LPCCPFLSLFFSFFSSPQQLTRVAFSLHLSFSFVNSFSIFLLRLLSFFYFLSSSLPWQLGAAMGARAGELHTAWMQRATPVLTGIPNWARV